MNDAAHNFIEPEVESEEVYRGLSFEVQAILDAGKQIEAKCRDLAGSFKHRQTVSMKLAADDIALITGQANNLAAHLASVCARHIERRKQEKVS